MRAYLENACEEIDAAIYTGDVLEHEDERAELKRYVERWLGAIENHVESKQFVEGLLGAMEEDDDTKTDG